MHSLPPIAGITCVSGSSVDAEARLVEGRDRLPELGAAAVRRVLVRAGVAHRARPSPRRCARGVGVSGSPIPSEITSTPAACFSAILRSSSREQVGRDRSRRCDAGFMPPPPAPRTNSSENSPSKTGSAQPVSVTSSSSPTSTSSSPPSSSTVTGLRAHRAARPRPPTPEAPVPDESVSPTPRSKIRARTRCSDVDAG